MKESLYKNYFDQVQKYKQEFKTDELIVLIQVGSFYEFYEMETKEKEQIGDARKLAGQLNLQIGSTDKSKEPGTLQNPYMCGFPISKLDTKYKEILVTQLNYTVVIISQTSEPPNPKREVTEIISPSTYLSEEQNWNSNYILTIFIEEMFSKVKDVCIYSIGSTAVELTTGEIYIQEATDTLDDNLIALEETYRFIQKFKPKEVQIYCSKNYNEKKYSKEYILQFLEINTSKIMEYWKDYSELHLDLNYQNTRLKSIFKTGCDLRNLTAISELDLEKYPNAIISLTLAIQFISSRSNYLLNNISRPIYISESDELILDYNCSKQLDIVSENYCLYTLLNNTCTAMGSRELRKRLLSPIKNSKELEYRYNLIEKLNDSKEEIRKMLKEISDLSRIFRKISLGKLSTTNFIILIDSINSLKRINKNKNVKIVRNSEKIKEIIDEMKEWIEGIFEIINGLLNFKKGINEELDEIKEKIEKENQKLNNTHKELNEEMLKIQPTKSRIKKEILPIKLEFNERDGYYFLITKVRFNLLKKANEDLIKDYSTKIITNSIKMSNEITRNHSTKVGELTNKLNEIITKEYYEKQIEFNKKFGSEYNLIIKYINDLDISCSGAINAENYSYSKPKIENLEKKDEKEQGQEGERLVLRPKKGLVLTPKSQESYLEIKEIRHPIVERISKKERFTTNDISLTEEESGILLFGLNMCGKSTLMKAVGMSVVMAQAGLYVPAKEFKYKPFERILTRISDGDNILKGMSTFAIEMTELNTILKRSTKNSLVIGDEICHGTEQYSGSGIVGASLIKLSEKNVKYLFATHLHNLSESKRIKEIRNLRIYHLEVKNENGKLVYTRKLQNGSGPSTYGIEVAEAMGMNKEFIKLAKEIRNEESGENETERIRSKYNKELEITNCEMCGTKKGTNKDSKYKPLETHHILFQCNADKNGKHDSVHKNELCNLVILCRDCHMKVHREKIEITGHKITEEGIKLIIK